MSEWNILKAVVLLVVVGGMFVRLVVKETRRRERCLRLRKEELKLESDMAEQQRKLAEQAPTGGRGVLEALYLNKMLRKPKKPIWSAKGMYS